MKLFPGLPTVLFLSLTESVSTKNQDVFPKSLRLDADEEHSVLLETVLEHGLNASQHLIEVQEEELYYKGAFVRKSEPAHFLSVFNKQKPQSKLLSKYAYASLHASGLLSRRFQLTREQVLYGLEKVQLRSTSIFDECPLKSRQQRQEECSGFASVFRTPDGTCNNLAHPVWGSAFMPFLRFLPADYSDGISAFRRSHSNGPLPNPRRISASIHRDERHDTTQFTMMVMQWGQFTDHDITSTPTTRGFKDSILKCCSDDGHTLDNALLHPDCKPIVVPTDDKFYSAYNVTCMEFVRSAPTPRHDCSLGPRDQLNQITSYIDASNIYGSTAEEQHSLRLMKKGKLKYTDLHIRKPLLPALSPEHAEEECRSRTPNLHCFKAGDDRVNEQPGLATLHTLWLREHNRVAIKLGKINPHWSDDRIFLETRKFIGGVMQHITYNEWLPIVLGSRVINIFELQLLPQGYYTGYNESVNPTIANSFATAAFRFGHSLVKSSIERCNKEFRKVPFHIDLHKEMNNPSNLHNFGSVDRVLLGLVNTKLSRRDEFISKELTNHLFQTPRSHFGMDLASINIQRGRDHGLAPYNIWREQCGLKRFQTWDEVFEAMDEATAERMRSVYEDIDDVDLFTGGMAERPVVGGIIGPTFACILGQQFLNLRRGDRFWYENGNHPGAFTPEQLQEIRKTSLSRIICDCLDDVEDIQPFAFLQPDLTANKRTPCRGRGIPRIDLRKWKEDPNLRPQQLNSLDVHPLLKDLLQQNASVFATEEPIRPVFTEGDKDYEVNEILETVDNEGINDFIAKPNIGLEWNVKYNDELPNQLSPDSYFNLNWALAADRQKLNYQQ